MSLAFQPRGQYKQSLGHLGNQEAQLGAEAGQALKVTARILVWVLKGSHRRVLGGCTVSMFVFLFFVCFFSRYQLIVCGRQEWSAPRKLRSRKKWGDLTF